MIRKHILIILTCIGLLGSVGCTPTQVKRLAIQVHFATEEKQVADQKVYELVAELAKNDLNLIVDQYKQRLEKEHWRMQFRIVQIAHERWLQQYEHEIEEMNNRFNTQIVSADEERKKLYAEAPDWPEDPLGEVPNTEEKWKQSFQSLSEIHDSQIRAYKAHLNLLEKKRQLASGHERIVKAILSEREAVVAQLLRLNEGAYSQACTELEQMEAGVRRTDAQLQEVLNQMASLDKAIANGSLALRDYLLRKSELALFVGGLLKGLDISPDIAKAEATADEVAISLGEKLEGMLNKYVNKMSTALEDNAKNGTNP